MRGSCESVKVVTSCGDLSTAGRINGTNHKKHKGKYDDDDIEQRRGAQKPRVAD
jgi:hypothetical protein